ncbi:MAG: protein translocase subunit SecD [Pseudomonadota bacterium]
MNRYPAWKYILIAVALLLGVLYTSPNYFVDSPALQITSGKSTVKVSGDTATLIDEALKREGIKSEGARIEGEGDNRSVRVRFDDTQSQFNAKPALEKALNRDVEDPSFIVTVGLVKNTPGWMRALRAMPMNLGLDLRGGVHFLMQVDTKGALDTRIKAIQSAVKGGLREKNIRHGGIERVGDAIVIKFHDLETRGKAKDALTAQSADLLFAESSDGSDQNLSVTLKPAALTKAIEDGVKQNIATLSKRVNELGVSEPVIQQQGADRIVVELPGVQDVALAKKVIGRTATLELRMVDESIVQGTELTATLPLNAELFTVGKGVPVVLSKEVVLTGDYIANATGTVDQQTQQPIVSLELNGDGGRKMRMATREHVGKRMAIVLYEKKGKPEVLSTPVIQSELGTHFQISGMGTSEAANELALLLRSGALYAPMDFVEERVVGPQLGAENIARGLHSVVYGFIAIAVFMILYYYLFGFFSVLALACNLLLLMALLSLLQLTLTLPGIAAIALALGMAIDANVLINERIREELRNGNTPQAAIAAGFDRAWATILDSNVTTLIVGLSLLIFGSGPVRGFAWVHCLGIMTSMFSAVFVSRGVVNLWYGRKKKLSTIAIGTVWTPGLSK